MVLAITYRQYTDLYVFHVSEDNTNLQPSIQRERGEKSLMSFTSSLKSRQNT